MTDSLKKMLGSVDWSKLVSHGDARNALVGSALGGLMLGGASLLQDRDPEESKAAPVGDALMGALLGGAAGYGIPKGLAMFRDAGHLAPDGDTLKPRSGLLGDAADGATWGAGLGIGAGLARDTPAYASAWKRLVNKAIDSHDVRLAATREQLQRYVQLHHDKVARGAGGTVGAQQVRKAIRELTQQIRRDIPVQRATGILGSLLPQNVIREMPNQAEASPSIKWTWKGKEHGFDFTHGSKYNPGKGRGLLGIGRVREMGPVRQLLSRYLRRGRNGALLGAGAMLAFPAAKKLFSRLTSQDSAN